MRPFLACLVAGARPNFVKAAALHHAFRHSALFRVRLVDTGQHYDDAMAGSFFRALGLETPDASLGAGSGSHAVQTARILEGFETELMANEPDVVVVVGDVNSTLAGAVVAAKAQYADGRRPLVAHVEAGLRSFDRTMPEEINRIVTDSIADLHFVTEQSGVDNLLREGHASDHVFLVGNVMMDTLLAQAPRARARAAWQRFDLRPGHYGIVTLHRPSNVDHPDRLSALIQALEHAARRLPLIFPVHPRTQARLDAAGIGPLRHLRTCEPLPYVDFLSLLTGARAVVTDSGGLQEETTMLGVPCLTLRDNTERPITITHGTNRLIGSEVASVRPELDAVLAAPLASLPPPPYWDGAAATRVVEILERAVVASRQLQRAQPAPVV